MQPDPRRLADTTSWLHKAANDPMVLAMAHVYLGRISENEGHVAEALAEYRAASAVEGAPGQALEAAKRGIESTESRLKQAKP